MTHTKGHWHVGQGNGEGSIFADEGRMRLTDKGTALYPICTMVRGWNDAEDEANARLVAAAPALHAALAGIMHWWQWGKGDEDMPAELFDAALEALIDARG